MTISATPDQTWLGSQATLAFSRSLAGVRRVFKKFTLFMSTLVLSLTSRPARTSDICASGWNSSSSGRRIATAVILNASCTVAAAKAR